MVHLYILHCILVYCPLIIALHCSVQYYLLLRCVALCFNVLHFVALCCIMLRSFIFCCIVLHLMYCVVLCCNLAAYSNYA